jgi:hypothetical protein
MSSARSRLHGVEVSNPIDDRTALFKQDRPRRIDQYISFFGDESRDEPRKPDRAGAWHLEQ